MIDARSGGRTASRARRRARGADRPRAAARAPARAADARALSLRAPGGRARGLPAARGRRSSSRSASSPARSCASSTRRSCARTRALAGPARPSSRRSWWPRRHSLGRDAELELLRAAWARACAGRGGVAVVVGAAGQRPDAAGRRAGRRGASSGRAGRCYGADVPRAGRRRTLLVLDDADPAQLTGLAEQFADGAHARPRHDDRAGAGQRGRRSRSGRSPRADVAAIAALYAGDADAIPATSWSRAAAGCPGPRTGWPRSGRARRGTPPARGGRPGRRRALRAATRRR